MHRPSNATSLLQSQDAVNIGISYDYTSRYIDYGMNSCDPASEALSNPSQLLDLDTLDSSLADSIGTGWMLVRHVPASPGTWSTANDALSGSAEVDPSRCTDAGVSKSDLHDANAAEFSCPWGPQIDEFLFATGDVRRNSLNRTCTFHSVLFH